MSLRDAARWICLLAAVGLADVSAAPPAYAEGEVCEAPLATGPVSLTILANGQKVRELAAHVAKKGGEIVRQDRETVVFADGRVITADVEGAGEHLGALGWEKRSVRIAATVPAKRARPRRARG